MIVWSRNSDRYDIRRRNKGRILLEGRVVSAEIRMFSLLFMSYLVIETFFISRSGQNFLKFSYIFNDVDRMEIPIVQTFVNQFSVQSWQEVA